MKNYFFLFCICTSLLISCTSQNSHETKGLLHIDIGNSQFLKLRSQIITHQDSTTLEVYNGPEIIRSHPFHKSTAGKITFPYFDKYFQIDTITTHHFIGALIDPNRKQYSLPLTFKRTTTHFSQPKDTIQYHLAFSPNTPDYYPGHMNLVRTTTEQVYATILTETGDYRYLEGTLNGKQLELQVFDGAHIFLFTAQVSEDSITNGVFHSGSHWQEPFQGKQVQAMDLTNPFALTTSVGNFQTLSVINDQQKVVHIDSSTFQDRPLTLIQIMGTWCPNCLDETQYYTQLKKQYPALNILTIAYEIPKDTAKALEKIANYKQDIPAITWPIYYGGRASKSLTSSHFPFLTAVISYPTTLFIDSKGQILKVHTGFYGPATGPHYEKYTREMEQFIQEKLNTKKGA